MDTNIFITVVKTKIKTGRTSNLALQPVPAAELCFLFAICNYYCCYTGKRVSLDSATVM
jgi:hypothetical protein